MERTNSLKLPSDLHIHQVAHMYSHINVAYTKVLRPPTPPIDTYIKQVCIPKIQS